MPAAVEDSDQACRDEPNSLNSAIGVRLLSCRYGKVRDHNRNTNIFSG